MLIVSIDYVPNKELILLEIVQGSTILVDDSFKDFIPILSETTFQTPYFSTQILSDARKIATTQMQKDAKSLNADAIINVRFCLNTLLPGTYEIITYGTAVKFKQVDVLHQF